MVIMALILPFYTVFQENAIQGWDGFSGAAPGAACPFLDKKDNSTVERGQSLAIHGGQGYNQGILKTKGGRKYEENHPLAGCRGYERSLAGLRRSLCRRERHHRPAGRSGPDLYRRGAPGEGPAYFPALPGCFRGHGGGGEERGQCDHRHPGRQDPHHDPERDRRHRHPGGQNHPHHYGCGPLCGQRHLADLRACPLCRPGLRLRRGLGPDHLHRCYRGHRQGGGQRPGGQELHLSGEADGVLQAV